MFVILGMETDKPVAWGDEEFEDGTLSNASYVVSW
jgi:hypothetical protein